ncbi:glutaminyl-peptide cyclotransferase [Sphingobacterium sp. HJSM2_6]|uniref:glutaminyl-peptide cyclotransferase n=1 Tax=Sphingobacterium sp. HJSM2_6 TaxID=3366264 RepID=UPI003BE4B978
MKITAKLCLLVTIISVLSCKTQQGKFEFLTPSTGSRVLKGEKIQLKLNFPNPAVDSVVYAIDGNVFERKVDTTTVLFDSNEIGYGNKRLSATVYAAGKEDITYSELLIVPPAPKPYAFEVVQTYPHDPNAFTQGLYYDGTILYESTGMNGRSSIRKVELATGKVLLKKDLEEKYFGEGMTVVGNEVFMLTWESNIGFVFNKQDFNTIKTFDYQQSKQGWGLTYDGTRFIKSDGSNKLFFLDKSSLKETGFIQVFDDNGPVDSINELEYIDGKVYANLYHADKDIIVIIDPNTGVVEGKINFVGLYDGKRASTGNEMNGIAYKSDAKSLLVTGKDWTKLYEVKLKDR